FGQVPGDPEPRRGSRAVQGFKPQVERHACGPDEPAELLARYPERLVVKMETDFVERGHVFGRARSVRDRRACSGRERSRLAKKPKRRQPRFVCQLLNEL